MKKAGEDISSTPGHIEIYNQEHLQLCKTLRNFLLVRFGLNVFSEQANTFLHYPQCHSGTSGNEAFLRAIAAINTAIMLLIG